MSLIEQRLAEHEFKQEIQLRWGGYILAAGYRDLSINTEESLIIGGQLARAAAKILNLTPGSWAEIAQVEAMSDEQKRTLRDTVRIVQPQYEPKGFS
jgi:hypothetical protein